MIDVIGNTISSESTSIIGTTVKPGASMKTALSLINYPNPYFNPEAYFLPTSIRILFKWCRFFYYKNAQIHAGVNKLADYAITDVHVEVVSESKDGAVVDVELSKDISRFLNFELDIKTFLLSSARDYFTLGNSYSSIGQRIHRTLICRRCHIEIPAEQVEKLHVQNRNKNIVFRGQCPQCKARVDFDFRDTTSGNFRELFLVSWPVMNMVVKHNLYINNSEYYYTPPEDELKLSSEYVAATPIDILEAILKQRRIHMDKSSFIATKAPSLSDFHDGYGLPIILSAINDAFFLLFLKRAQMAIAAVHIVPLVLLFPMQTTSQDQYASPIDMGDWKTHVEGEIKKWRKDPTYISVMPIPIGYKYIGGDVQALNLNDQMTEAVSDILIGMGVMKEFIYGGLNWSGTSVSLRLFNNSIINIQHKNNLLLDKFAQRISKLVGKKVKLTLQSPTTVDDIQRKQILLSLNSSKKISDETLLEEYGISVKDEIGKMITDLKERTKLTAAEFASAAKAQSEANVLANKISAAGKVETDATMKDTAANVGVDLESITFDPNVLASAYSNQLLGMSPTTRDIYLSKLNQQMPQLYGLIKEKLTQAQLKNPSEPKVSAIKSVDNIRPLPEQKPPRRKGL